MKKSAVLCFILILLPILGLTQTVENIEFVSPFHDDVAAIKKDGRWAFINEEGQLIMDFRTDLVVSKNDDGEYPIFNNNRCKIVEVKAGISYFGFIDKSGNIVVKPEFLGSTNFIEGTAIALKLDKEIISKNIALGKDVVNYRYFEVLINTDGEVTYYLTQEGVTIVLDKKYLREIPKITSKYLTTNLYAAKRKNNTWSIIKIKE